MVCHRQTDTPALFCLFLNRQGGNLCLLDCPSGPGGRSGDWTSLSQVESCQRLMIGTPLAARALPGAWRCRASTRTGWTSVCRLWLGEMIARLICNIYLSATKCVQLPKQTALWYSVYSCQSRLPYDTVCTAAKADCPMIQCVQLPKQTALWYSVQLPKQTALWYSVCSCQSRLPYDTVYSCQSRLPYDTVCTAAKADCPMIQCTAAKARLPYDTVCTAAKADCPMIQCVQLPKQIALWYSVYSCQSKTALWYSVQLPKQTALWYSVCSCQSRLPYDTVCTAAKADCPMIQCVQLPKQIALWYSVYSCQSKIALWYSVYSCQSKTALWYSVYSCQSRLPYDTVYSCQSRLPYDTVYSFQSRLPYDTVCTAAKADCPMIQCVQSPTIQFACDWDVKQQAADLFSLWTDV